MVRAGDVISNEVSGESIRFLRTAADTGGAHLEWEHTLRPGARVPSDHRHAIQEEHFEVLAGTAVFRVGRQRRELGPGDSITIPAGTVHGLWNGGPDDVQIRCTLTPAGRTEDYFAEMCRLAAAGKVRRRGVPGLVRLAVTARELRQQDYLPGPPVRLQRVGLAVAGRLGRVLGIRYGQ